MATFSKLIFNGGNYNGQGIQVSTATTPTGIHRTNGVSGVIDEVWLWATNVAINPTPVNLAVTFGGTGTTNQVSMSIAPATGPILVIPGWSLVNTGGALDVSASAAISGALNIYGYVNRITP